MSFRHPYYNVIIAYLAGKTIQRRTSGCAKWEDLRPIEAFHSKGHFPNFSGGFHYRVKPEPKTACYRNYLSSWGDKVYVSACNNLNEAPVVENSSFFVRWLGDWQEVEA